VLTKWDWLDPVRKVLERSVTERFVRYFADDGVTVPARFSLIAMDGDWQVVCSHAAGGPGSGHMFAVDLEGKSRGLLGYLWLLPQLIVTQGGFGSTMFRVTVRDALRRITTRLEAQIAEGVFTNRTFVLAPPIVSRDEHGALQFSLRGLFTVIEGAAAGILSRAMHLIGLDPGRLATGGRLRSPYPDHQLTLTEGGELDISYHHRDGRRRAVPTEVSGDPYVASRMTIRVAWGPLPMLATPTSLMAECARRALTRLRTRHALALGTETLNMIEFFVYAIGTAWDDGLSEQTGLFRPPPTLRLQLRHIQQRLLHTWEGLGTGTFVDTSAPGIQLGRRGLYAHNHDQTAHLVLIRERAGSLLVRQIRAAEDGCLFEAYAWYRAMGGAFVIRNCQVRRWQGGAPPSILREEQYFRTAEGFQEHAPAFFPFLPRDPDGRTLSSLHRDVTGGDEPTSS
jgi:hypothetical protein